MKCTIIILLLSLKLNAQIIDLSIIAQIESSNDSLAHNITEGSRGLYQIRPICLQDYNELNNTNYTLEDLFTVSTNEKIAIWYLNVRIPQLLKHYGYKITINNTIIAYNAGIKYLAYNITIPKSTVDYIKKYRKLRNGRNRRIS